MGASRFNEDDDEYVELLQEYERYMRSTPGAYEDFEDWLDLTYGDGRKKKFIKRSPRRTKDEDY